MYNLHYLSLFTYLSILNILTEFTNFFLRPDLKLVIYPYCYRICLIFEYYLHR